MDDIFYQVFHSKFDSNHVIDVNFVSNIVKDLSQNVVSIPRSMGLHDIHLSCPSAFLGAEEPVAFIQNEEPNDKDSRESVTDIIEYCFTQAGARVAANEMGVPAAHQLLNDRLEKVGMSQSMCSNYKMQKSPGRGAWSRIKRVFSSLSGRPRK